MGRRKGPERHVSESEMQVRKKGGGRSAEFWGCSSAPGSQGIGIWPSISRVLIYSKFEG